MNDTSAVFAVSLPIDDVLPDLLEHATQHNRLLLHAPPGAGKTTRVPLALLGQMPLNRRIIMLEPRRLAARAAASHMAALLGEDVGQTVGYRVRFESRVSAKTRLEIVTEGVLTRMLRDDPDLPGVEWLIFDEFHERSVQADLGLALALECQDVLRDATNPLRILVMSATLHDAPLANLLGGCPVVRSEGRAWPVTTHYMPPKRLDQPIEERVVEAVRLALNNNTGDVLVFLPGAAEIRRVAAQLGIMPKHVHVHKLYGELSPVEQDAALAPAPGGARKVILSSAIAESSLTIEGVRVVVDAGLCRTNRFDPGTGANALVTHRVSSAGADQRRGRAGRLGAGVCYRLWHEHDEVGFQPFPRAEVLDADLADMRLELAAWGIDHPATLRWLDTPPVNAWQHASDLLCGLEALAPEARSSEILHQAAQPPDEAGNFENNARLLLTAHGRHMASLPVHPRIAHMLIQGQRAGLGEAACLLAAVLAERDPLRGQSHTADVRTRLAWLAARSSHTGHTRLRHFARRMEHMTKTWRCGEPVLLDEAIERAGELLALAYPERVAQQRGERGGYRFAGGRGGKVLEDDPLFGQPWLAVGAVDSAGRDARIFQAAPITVSALNALFANRMQRVADVRWDAREEAVLARESVRLGTLIMQDAAFTAAPEALLSAAMLDGVRAMGLTALPWTADLQQWRARVAFLGALEPETWPDVRDVALLDMLELWLQPFLGQATRRTHLKNVDLQAALQGLLPQAQVYTLLRRLDAHAPARLQVPSGAHIRLHYAEEPLAAMDASMQPHPPVLAVKVQEMFGLGASPCVGGGNIPVVIHLLSPAGRPLQVTSDLASFWKNGYPAVRAEMRGRYPRHPWPEDPWAAPPTRKVKPRG